MQFSQIPGLPDIKQRLISSVNNKHIAHAQLFFSAEGSASLPLALAYATYINCENKLDTDSCGSCQSCSKYNKLIHPDLHFVFPVSTTKAVPKDALSTSFMKDWRKFLEKHPFGGINDWSSFIAAENKQLSISVDEARNIIKSLIMKSYEAEYKVLIIWLPEFMNLASANAILKILEEPPAKTIFLLVTNNNEKIITTILSRTLKVRIPAFSEDEVKKHLVTFHNADEKKAKQLAWIAEGNINEAIRLVNEVEEDNHEMFREWMRACYRKNNIKDLMQWTETFQTLGRESQKSLLQYGLNIIRETLIFPHSPSLVKLQAEDFKFVEGFSKVLSSEKVEKITALLNEAHYHIERNANAKITFLDVSLSLSSILKT